jgi:hypothetical protein
MIFHLREFPAVIAQPNQIPTLSETCRTKTAAVSGGRIRMFLSQQQVLPVLNLIIP